MAQLECYLSIKLENAGSVKGDSTCKGYEDDIVIESFEWSEELPQDQATRVNNQGYYTRIGDFKFKMKANKASPVLMQACFKMDIITEAVLKCCRDTNTGKQEFMKWTLKTGLISSFKTIGDDNDVLPVDRFAIRFIEGILDFKPQVADRSLGPAFSGKFNVATMQ